jgi:hypothetical protein
METQMASIFEAVMISVACIGVTVSAVSLIVLALNDDI